MNRSALAALVVTSLAAVSGCTQEKTCPTDQHLCGDACVALDVDPRNCGACGNVCASGEACHQGACTTCAAACGAGQRCEAGLCVADVYAACYDTDEVRAATSDLAAAGVPLATDTGPISIARLGDQLYVANSRSNTISAISFSPAPSATHGPAAIQLIAGAVQFADLEYVTSHDGLLWVSNAAAGTLVAVDPLRGVIDEVPLAATAGEFVNPLGVDFVGSKAYVALGGPNAVAVVDVSSVSTCQPPSATAPACPAAGCGPGATCVNGLCQRSSCGKVLTRIDLSGFAPAGASAGPSRVLAEGSIVYVTLNDLGPLYAPVPGANGRVVVIDAGRDAALGPPVDLGPSCIDAYGLALAGSRLWVTCGFSDYQTHAVTGGALVPIDVGSTPPVAGAAIPLTHAATEIVFCGSFGYAGASDEGTLLRLDPATGAVQTSQRLLCPPRTSGGSSYIPAVACAPSATP